MYFYRFQSTKKIKNIWIIYNVTVKIDRDKTDEWLHWMKHHHIPEVLNTEGFFSLECRLSKLLT
ncbi:MAG: DUF4286 family protein [Saprospiraceae bacterium]|nr:DUF4286 family protein [Candidatus Vicinibacter affinis]